LFVDPLAVSDDDSDMHDQGLIERLGKAVAREMPIVYAEKGRKNVSEMRHLQPATNRVLERLAPTWMPAPALGSKKFGDMLGWVGLGHVDNVLTWPDGSRTFLELKCGNDLSACVWDMVKLAAAVLGGNATSAYMLAGASVASWQKPTPGAEFFRSQEWQTMGFDVRARYEKWWRFWQNETTPHLPGRVAPAIRTVTLGSFGFVIAGEAWELRLARVEPVRTDWVDWPPIEPI
jgi:hypothetical protein